MNLRGIEFAAMTAVVNKRDEGVEFASGGCA